MVMVFSVAVVNYRLAILLQLLVNLMNHFTILG